MQFVFRGLRSAPLKEHLTQTCRELTDVKTKQNTVQCPHCHAAEPAENSGFLLLPQLGIHNHLNVTTHKEYLLHSIFNQFLNQLST